MGMFNRHSYVKLAIPKWFELRMFDPSATKDDMQLASGWVGRVSEHNLEAVKALLDSPETDRYLRPLMNLVTGLDREANEQLLALAFADGWRVADLEAESRLAKPRRASGAALLAISMLRRTFGEHDSLTMANMLDAGYFANRTDLDPLAFALKVIEGSDATVKTNPEERGS